MKTMHMFCAVAILIVVGVGAARASEDDGQSAPQSVATTRAPRLSISDTAARTFLLFTIGGVEVRVWAPVALPYNAEANGNLAAREIWSAE